MNGLMPKTASVSDLQRDYVSLLSYVEKTKEPLVILKDNQPRVALVDIGELEKLYILKRLADYEVAKKTGKLLTATSVDELFKMVANEGDKISLRKKVSKSANKTFSRRTKKD